MPASSPLAMRWCSTLDGRGRFFVENIVDGMAVCWCDNTESMMMVPASTLYPMGA